jgi:hypothetical protein
VNSQEIATQVTTGAVARTPKMIPNFKRSMMMSNPSRPPLEVPESLHEGGTGPSRRFGSLDPTKENGEGNTG